MYKSAFFILILGGVLFGSMGMRPQMTDLTSATSSTLQQHHQMTATPTFIHTVFFWMKRDNSESDIATFEEGLSSLTTIEEVRDSWIGKPAGTPREVVDNSYDYALILHFDSKEKQDAYQVAPVHKAFIEKSAHTWERVQVYDTWVE